MTVMNQLQHFVSFHNSNYSLSLVAMDQNGGENFNETELKKILVNLERRYNENQKLRIKHAESPTKFAASETELFAILDEIQGVATQPELYPVLMLRNSLEILLSLVCHENSDISAKVIGIIQEFTDIDESDVQEPSEALMEALIGKNVIDIVVANLSRFDLSSKEDSQAIENSIAIIDNLIDFDSDAATNGSQCLIEWLLRTLKETLGFNPLKLSIAELLSVLLMSSHENKLHLNRANGIDILLQQVAYYRRIAPQTSDEHEFLEQTINCLCTAVLDCDENRDSFHKEEGIDLIELILREKRETIKKSNIKLSTLKLFNHILTTINNQDEIVTRCCARFIEILGLRVIFPLFNNPKLVLNEKVRKRDYHQFLDEVEEHTSAIILALLKNSQNSEHIQRILVKFAESNFEKMHRLLNLHDKYYVIVQNAQNGHESETQDHISSPPYFTLRTVDYILLLVSYLTEQYETYDPTSGETFHNFVTKTLIQRPQLRHQLLMETRRHIDEVANTKEERESLEFLLEHFKNIGK